MTNINISQTVSNFSGKASKALVAILLLAAFSLVTARPAQAQSSDTWKSIAIIGGSTAAGAYIGHKVAGSTGAYVGAGIGAAAGYAIDRRRRQNNEYNNGYYGDNGGYYPDNGGYYPNGGYGYPYASNGSYSNQQGHPYQGSDNYVRSRRGR